MTGMKEGAGEDPFADESGIGERDKPGSGGDEQRRSGTSERATEPPQTDTEVQIPYLYRRDSVQEGRDRFPLFLRPETKRAEREALREFEDRFDEDVALTDLREALVLAGLAHLDDVEAQLTEWGYGMTFDK